MSCKQVTRPQCATWPSMVSHQSMNLCLLVHVCLDQPHIGRFHKMFMPQHMSNSRSWERGICRSQRTLRSPTQSQDHWRHTQTYRVSLELWQGLLKADLLYRFIKSKFIFILIVWHTSNKMFGTAKKHIFYLYQINLHYYFEGNFNLLEVIYKETISKLLSAPCCGVVVYWGQVGQLAFPRC